MTGSISHKQEGLYFQSLRVIDSNKNKNRIQEYFEALNEVGCRSSQVTYNHCTLENINPQILYCYITKKTEKKKKDRKR
jgi:hypothetical protein